MERHSDQRTLIMRIIIFLGLFFIVPFFLYSQQVGSESYTQKLNNFDKGIDMVAVPGGSFEMGDKKSGTQIQVELSSFWIGKYEIPWDIYELFVYESADLTKNDNSNENIDALTRPSPPYLDMTFGMGKYGFPAVGMTQYNAIQFCKWLYLRTGVFYRLPTEAEWEYACRAGTETPYFFGNTNESLVKYAWFNKNSADKTHPIGTKEPNAWNIYDMYGNAAEWTYDQFLTDFYKKFQGKSVKDPVAFPEKLYPISVRGGSFKDSAASLRSDSRSGSDPSWNFRDPQTPKSNWWYQDAPFIGVRIVRPNTALTKEEIEKYYNRKPIPDY